jgi:hypothetical protein
MNTKRLPLLALFLLCVLTSSAQSSGGLYGLVRDSVGCRLGTMNLTTGAITPLSTAPLSPGFVLTGSCLNPYTNTYHYFNNSGIVSADLSTGAMVSTAPLSNPSGDSYFDAPQFNNADSSIYGISRRSFIDTLTGLYTGSLHLGKVNPTTGVITDISPTSLGVAFLLNGGSAIDPYMMTYYFFTGETLLGVDLYTGTVLTSTVPALPDNEYIDNLVFHCGDSTLYGLFRHNAYDTVWLDSTLFYLDLNVDSSRLSLASIDPATGVVSEVSGARLGFSYLLNAGITIDPVSNLLYFQTMDSIFGVDISTGMVANRFPQPSGGIISFDMMREFQNCFYATRIRTGTESASTLSWQVSPNPTQGSVRIQADAPLRQVQLIDLQGRVLHSQTLLAPQAEVDLSVLPSGIYLLRAQSAEGASVSRRVVRY